jgi:hypothetical protein
MSDLVTIEGMDEVIREFKKIDNDALKRREILKLLRRQAKPLLKAVTAAAPIIESGLTKTRKKAGGGVATYEPGNLKKAMAIKTSPLKNYPNVLVGFRQGVKAKYDGYYGFFVVYGYAGKHRVAPNDFIWRAGKPLLPEINTKGSLEMRKYILKMIEKRTKL